MAHIQLANGQTVKELRVWDGSKWVAKKGRIYDGARWIDFIRPSLTFKDDFASLIGMSRFNASTHIKSAVNAGTTILPVQTSTGFYIGQEVTITDGVNSESVRVTAISDGKKNLIPPFNEWNLHARAEVMEPYKLKLDNTEDLVRTTAVFINVIPGETYTIQVKETSEFRGNIRVGDTGSLTATNIFYYEIGANNSFTRTFTPSTNRINIGLGNQPSESGPLLFEEIQLELGTIATAFEPKSEYPILHVSPLKNTYTNNAIIARSNSIINGGKLWFDTLSRHELTVKENLLPPLSEWINIHSNATILDDYTLQVLGVSSQRWSHVDMEVIPGRTYTFSIKETSGLAGWYVLRSLNPIITHRSTTFTNQATYTFTPATSELTVRLSPGSTTNGTVIFAEMSLVLEDE